MNSAKDGALWVTLYMAVSRQSEMTTLEELGDLKGTAGARVDNNQPSIVDYNSALEPQKGRARLPDV